MEYLNLDTCPFSISRITLGTWAIGGWMWGGNDEQDSVDTILEAINQGITTIDTAAIYGFGKAERLVGQALKQYGDREELILATKGGLEWDDKQRIKRNSKPDRLRQEVEDSLQRLGTNYIDLYQVHWPDHQTSFAETAEALQQLMDEGKIRTIGVSNFSPAQMDEFRKAAPIHFCQPPYNLFEREIEGNVKPYCHNNNIALITYGALCRGLLSGKMHENIQFQGDDLRRVDPKFKGERYQEHLAAANALADYARLNHNKSLIALAVRWILDMGIETAIWGARRPDQVSNVGEVTGWQLTDADLEAIDEILKTHIQNPVGPEFMAPPA
jgi:aryl-alcohol dehydrogenase-like predicted oxidoreductase